MTFSAEKYPLKSTACSAESRFARFGMESEQGLAVLWMNPAVGTGPQPRHW
jgi:hypothetical protein